MRAWDVPDEVVQGWADAHGLACDVAWHRQRRRKLAAPKSMTDDELVEAVRVLIREGQARAAERASTQADERLWMLNPLVDGRPMSDLSREQVEHVAVAADWHLAGRP